MSERLNGPDGEEPTVAEVVPGAEGAEVPAGDAVGASSGVPAAVPQTPAVGGVGWYRAPEPAAPQLGDPWPVAPPRVRPKTVWWLFAAGIVTPPAVYYLSAIVLSAIPSSAAQSLGFLSTGLVLLVPVSFAVLLVWFLMSRSAGKVRLASFLKGAVWSYAIIPLGFLLLFGACFLPR